MSPALAALPPVSAVIKVCALDAPYLVTIVPHMIRQARFPFAETLLIADPRTHFTGKYAHRAPVSEDCYRRALERLLDLAVVDRVLWADGPEPLQDASRKYFVGSSRVDASHDETGAPIHSALYGLEAASSDLVLLMDADMLFHASGPSWVAAGAAKLQEHADLWFVMTHAGPPAPGSLPNRLDARNERWGQWREDLGAFCFRHMSSRYFLTDRRRLRGVVPTLQGVNGIAPLEVCLSAALEREHAWRGNLAIEGSWDLHVEDHRPPFPALASKLVALVERGLVPHQQHGNYDLNLRARMLGIPWRRLIEREFPDFNPAAHVD